RIPLGRNFLPEVCSVALPFFPAFEHVWRVRIEITLTFAPWPDIRSDSTLAPMTHGSLTDSKAMGDLLGSQPLPLEVLDLLIACLSLSSVRRDRPFDLLSWSRTPFLNRYPDLPLRPC